MYKIHVFQYSKRQGTKAAEFKNQVVPEIKEKRSKEVISLSNKTGHEYNEKYIGKVIEVLIEEKEANIFKGHAKNYMHVIVENAKSDISNEIVKVKIENSQNEFLIRKFIKALNKKIRYIKRKSIIIK